MKTTTEDCGCKGSPQATGHPVECKPCCVPPLCRNHYYKGKLLTARDFAGEQAYHSDKLRLHHMELHGWGVVCGFKVKRHPHCPQLRVVVEPGFAIDPCGREVRLCEPVEIKLPEPPPPPVKTGCDDPDSTSTSPRPPSVAEPYHEGEHHHDDEDFHEHEHHHDDEDSHEHEGHHREGGDDDDRHGHEGHHHEGEGNRHDDDDDDHDQCETEPIDLYLCVRYVECETELSKAIFDECACPPANMQPNRICEGAEVLLYTEKPKWWDDVHPKGCDESDCGDIFKEALGKCPCPPEVPCIPIAVIRGFVPGEEVEEHDIDNWEPRPRLVSTTLLDRAIHCILDKLPTKELTTIVDTNWNHGDEYSCHEFMADYVVGNAAKGLRIQFDSKVYSRAINTRTFQALIVFRPRDHSRPHTMEIAPGRIETSPDETDWCRLWIDPSYAKRSLDEADFDVYVTLRCNVITGKHGLAVDGNLLAVKPHDSPYHVKFPTGDHTPGGTFESWFSVRHAGKTT